MLTLSLHVAISRSESDVCILGNCDEMKRLVRVVHQKINGDCTISA